MIIFTIVVIEDEFETRRGIISTISEQCTGYRVIGEAKDGQHGLSLVTQLQPDLVISDVRMPGMSGLEMMELLREQNDDTLTLLISGYDDFSYAQKAIHLGALDYVLKPCSVELLQQTLINLRTKITHHLVKKFLNRIDQPLPRKESGEVVFAFEDRTNSSDFEHFFSKLLGSIDGYQDQFECTFHIRNEIVFLHVYNTSTSIGLELAHHVQQSYSVHDQENQCHPAIGITYNQDNLKSYETISSELFETLNQAYYLQNDSIVIHDGYRKELQEYYPIITYETELIRALCDYNEEELNLALENLFTFLYDKKPNRQNLEVKCISIMGHIIETLQPPEETMLSIWPFVRKEKEKIPSFFQLKQKMTESLRNLLASSSSTPKHGKLMSSAINYIELNYVKNIGLNDVADHLNITPQYLSTIFKKTLSHNFKSYLTEIRINKSMALLKTSHLSIKDIARQSGFVSMRTFLETFNKIVGMTPTEFRNKI